MGKIKVFFKKLWKELTISSEEYLERKGETCKFCKRKYLNDLTNLYHQLGFCCESHYHFYVLAKIKEFDRGKRK